MKGISRVGDVQAEEIRTLNFVERLDTERLAMQLPHWEISGGKGYGPLCPPLKYMDTNCLT